MNAIVSLCEVLGDLYGLAVDENGDFSYKKKLIKAVKSVMKKDVLHTAKKVFLDSSTPRLEVLMLAKGSDAKAPPGVIREVSQFKKALSDTKSH